MSVAYKAVQWNKHKRVYDLWLIAGVLVFIAAFVAISKVTWAGDNAISDEVVMLRATAVCAFVMLHMILAIGPLARLSDRFAPLLYNRRHFGVTMFLIALFHGLLATVYYHGFGIVNPLVSLFTSDADYGSFIRFPFQPLGFVALLILFVMAATSHDFWLKNLSPRVWKWLHMLVYLAYGLLVMHVMLGAIQAERSAIYPALVIGGVVVIGGLHIAAGVKGARVDEQAAGGDWLDVCAVGEIPDDRATLARPAGAEPIAVFKYAGKVSAISNVCAHQCGPLGEGKIVDGCVTCPWHGYQYRPNDGQSPPPYTEKLPTYQVKIEGGRVFVNPKPPPPGTPVEPALIEGQHG